MKAWGSYWTCSAVLPSDIFPLYMLTRYCGSHSSKHSFSIVMPCGQCSLAENNPLSNVTSYAQTPWSLSCTASYHLMVSLLIWLRRGGRHFRVRRRRRLRTPPCAHLKHMDFLISNNSKHKLDISNLLMLRRGGLDIRGIWGFWVDVMCPGCFAGFNAFPFSVSF